MALRGSPAWFALGFFLVATIFFLAWWDHLPIIVQALRPAFDRDRKYLHPILWSGTARYVWGSLISLGLLALTEAGAFLAGRVALRWVLGAAPADGLVRLLLSLGLGHGLTGTLTAGFGFAGLLCRPLMWVVLALALAALPGGWRKPAMRSDGGAPPLQPQPLASAPIWIDRIILGICALIAVAGVAGLVLALGGMLNGSPGRFGLFVRTTPDDLPAFALAAAGLVAGVALLGWATDKAGSRARWVIGLLVACCAYFTVMQLTLALTPEWFYDSLVYHLAVPEQYLVNHKICYLGHTFISNYPFLQEMRYLFCMTLGDDVAPKLTHWADGLLAAAVAYALVRPFASAAAGWLAAALFLSAPSLRFLQTVTMVELGLTWFVALATLSYMHAMRWVPGASRGARVGWLCLTGCLLGLGHGVKYIGLNASVLVLGSVWFEDRRSGRSWRSAVRSQAVVIAAATVWTAVWLGKNWGFTGNPVFPFLHSVFPSLNWDASRQHLWMVDNTKYGIAKGVLLNWVGLPAMVSTESDVFGTFTFNPGPLLLVPFLFLFRSPPVGLRFLGTFAGLFAVVWSLSSQQVRFLLPMLPQAAAVAAFVVTRLGEGAWLVRAELVAASAWIIVMSAWGTVVNRTTSTVLVPYMTGHWSREEILRAALPYYEGLQLANRRMGPQDRILFIGGDESLYGTHNRICDSIYDFSTLGRLAARAGSPADLVTLLRRLRVTYVLVHERRAEEYASYGLFDWNNRARRNFLGLWAAWLHPVLDSKGIQVFELLTAPVPPAQRKIGLPTYLYPQPAVCKAGGLVAQINALLLANRWADALPLSDELVKTIPLAAHPYAYRGLILGQLHHAPESRRDFAQAVALGYPSGDAYFNLARYQSGKREYPAALENFMAAAEMEPGLRQLGRETALEIAIFLKRYDTALGLVRALAADNPGEKKYREQLGRLTVLAHPGRGAPRL